MFLGRLVWALAFRAMAQHEEKNEESTKAFNTAIGDLRDANADAIEELRSVGAQQAHQNLLAMENIREAINGVSQLVHQVKDVLKDEINGKVSALRDRSDEQLSLLHEKCNTQADRIGKAEAAIEALRCRCDDCAHICPFRNGKAPAGAALEGFKTGTR
jgi:hypothetical protein